MAQWSHLGWCHPGRQLTVSPLFFLEKKLTTFLIIAVWKVMTFFSCRLLTSPISFHVVHPVLFECHPLDGVTLGGPPFPPLPSPSDATGIVDSRLFNGIQSPYHSLSHIYFQQKCTTLVYVIHVVEHSPYAQIAFVNALLFPHVYFVYFDP